MEFDRQPNAQSIKVLTENIYSFFKRKVKNVVPSQ